MKRTGYQSFTDQANTTSLLVYTTSLVVITKKKSKCKKKNEENEEEKSKSKRNIIDQKGKDPGNTMNLDYLNFDGRNTMPWSLHMLISNLDYPNSQSSKRFWLVPTSSDNRGCFIHIQAHTCIHTCTHTYRSCFKIRQSRFCILNFEKQFLE